MMLLSTLFVLATASQGTGLRFVASTSKPVYAPGEQIVVDLEVQNPGKAPAVAAKAFSPVYPSGHLESKLCDATGKQLLQSSFLFEGQWGVGSAILPSEFVEIPAGRAGKVSEEKFAQVWTESRPTLKSEMETLPRSPLAPGKYTLTYTYSFERRYVRNAKGVWVERDPKTGKPGSVLTSKVFRQNAKDLYEKAFTGTLRTTVSFEVR